MVNNNIIILTLLFFVFVSFGTVLNTASAATISDAIDSDIQIYDYGRYEIETLETHDGKDSLKIMNSKLICKSSGPGTLQFYWKCPYYASVFYFADEDSTDGSCPGIWELDLNPDNEWEKVSLHYASGTHYFRWFRCGGPSYYNPIVYLDQVEWIPDAFKVVSTSPKKFTKKASRTSTIYIKFNKNIKSSVNWSKIVVMKNGKKIAAKKWISGNKILIKTSKRTKNTKYTVYIPKYAIKDNINNQFTSGYTFKFKTK